jgi:thiaminase (transcriptional activator TenA)
MPPLPPRTAQDMWNAAAPMIAVTEKHPFLTAMVDGSLAGPNFRYYVVQDALYLKDFAACLRKLGQTKDLPVDESARLEQFAIGAEEAELSLHHSFFQQWNIVTTASDEIQMPHTLLYTSYMERIVASRSYAEGLAVLLPCFWVYMHVGNEMLKLREQLGSRYARGWSPWYLLLFPVCPVSDDCRLIYFIYIHLVGSNQQ